MDASPRAYSNEAERRYHLRRLDDILEALERLNLAEAKELPLPIKERIDAGFARLEQGLPQHRARGGRDQRLHPVVCRPQPLGRRHHVWQRRVFEQHDGSHAAIVNHAFDSCLSKFRELNEVGR